MLALMFQALLEKCLFFLRTTDKAITTANVSQVSKPSVSSHHFSGTVYELFHCFAIALVLLVSSRK